MGRALLQSDRNAGLLIEVLRSLVAERIFKLQDFAIMPDHVHLLITVDEKMTIEKAMQMIKGRFSFRMKKELGALGEVWQRGFSEVRVLDDQRFEQHKAYIAANPVKAGLANSAGEFSFCYEYLRKQKAETKRQVKEDPQGLKPA
jgi:putative transposase